MDAPYPYPLAERLTEALLYFMIVASPWAFGATQEWAIRLMSGAGYGLGALWLCKRWVRWRTGYRPPRWGEEAPARGEPARYRPHAKLARWLTRSLAALTFLTLAYCLVSALNGRASYLLPEQLHDYHDRYVRWLPHSYADNLTWSAFWTYLGLGCFFWAARDWLLGKTGHEQRESRDEFGGGGGAAATPLPGRLTRLLWVLCLNGTLLGMVSIFQRLDGTDKLLWLVKPHFGGPDFHFGPFSYRGNGAQYFNLLWPVSLAFWWTLFRANQGSRRAGARIGGSPHLVLLPCVLVQLACPVISASHGGAVITTVLTVGALGVLLAANWRAAPSARLGMLVPFALGLALLVWLGWSQFQKGFLNAFTDDLGDRVEIYENARGMAVDHPLFGTGPGTFSALYHLYRTDTKDAWAVYAHNDWLETIITFGWIGFVLLLLLLAHVAARWWIRDGIGCRGDVPGLLWLALAGCLFHARFDFPLQIYSVLLLFLLLCSVCCCLAREETV